MLGGFVLDYLLFVFIAALGVLQMVAAYSALRGLLFVRVRSLAFVLGLLITVAAFIWFFLSEPRNIGDTEGGLDGNQMSAFFALGAGLALVLTLLVSSIINRSMGSDGGSAGQQLDTGLNALRQTTYLKALSSTLSTLKDRWKRR